MQSQVNVHGKVLCKEQCNQNILLSLVRFAGGVEQEKKTTTLDQDNFNFVFTKVFPGKYRIEVKLCMMVTEIGLFAGIFLDSSLHYLGIHLHCR